MDDSIDCNDPVWVGRAYRAIEDASERQETLDDLEGVDEVTLHMAHTEARELFYTLPSTHGHKTPWSWLSGPRMGGRMEVILFRESGDYPAFRLSICEDRVMTGGVWHAVHLEIGDIRGVKKIG